MVHDVGILLILKKVFSNLGPMLLNVGVWMNGKVVLFK